MQRQRKSKSSSQVSPTYPQFKRGGSNSGGMEIHRWQDGDSTLGPTYTIPVDIVALRHGMISIGYGDRLHYTG